MLFLLDSPFNLISVHVSNRAGLPSLPAHPGPRQKLSWGAFDSVYVSAGLAFSSQIRAEIGHLERVVSLRVQSGLGIDSASAARQAGRYSQALGQQGPWAEMAPPNPGATGKINTSHKQTDHRSVAAGHPALAGHWESV